MKEYDVLVAGGGTGRDIVLAAEARGLRTALVERGPIGGTCHNRGCMPSKMLIHSADVAETIATSERFGILSESQGVDYGTIVANVFGFLDEETEEREEALRSSTLVDFYQSEGQFIGPKTMRVDGDDIRAERVFIAGGTRPAAPPIPGLDTVQYHTSDTIFRLDKQPRRLVVVGGGYIAVELAHFFASLGTEVTILVRGQGLLDQADAEISAWLTEAIASKYDIRFGEEAEQVSARNGGIDVQLTSGRETIAADHLLIATGRVPNSDLWGLADTGVRLDKRGYVQVNDLLETGVDDVWAFGDITGLLTLKHVAVRQARNLIANVFDSERRTLDYGTVPHAVFSSPQVAAVGRTEEELRAAGIRYKAGRYEYKNTGMGIAIKENGLVKILASESDEILGCHIVGPHASVLIQEAVVAMMAGGRLDAITEAVHAHPALPQVVEEAAKAAAGAEPS